MDKEHFLKVTEKNKPGKTSNYNYDKVPEFFLSHDKITITCLKHGDFIQSAYTHSFGTGCMLCGREKTIENRTNTLTEFIEKAKQRFGDRFIFDKTKYKKLCEPLTITCKIHGDFTIVPKVFFRSSHGCSQCGYDRSRKTIYKKYIEQSREKYKNKFDYSRVNLDNCCEKVEIGCPIHGTFKQTLFNHSKGVYGCRKCSTDADRTKLDEFVSKARAVHGDRYNYDHVVLKNIGSKIKIGCKVHGEFSQRPHSHLEGYGCKKCVFEERLLGLDEFVSKARAVHGDKFDYSQVVYTGNKNHVNIICPKHGVFKCTPNAHVSHGTGCALCLESKGERAVEVFLKKYGFEFIREYKIKPYLYRYDFYIPEFNIYIEFNGKQHYAPVPLFGGLEEHLLVKERDSVKKDLVAQNNGNLIILTHFHLTDNVVDKELIRQLKKINFRWYSIDGKIVTFKTPDEVYCKFNIPKTILIRKLDNEVLKIVQNCKILF